ncbi:MAG: ABC transporter permease, partial [Candidatus Krumholzibacteria bacterium]|nr:ABC transporter permease [Candidatus Krumholzibacteria bacterium]
LRATLTTAGVVIAIATFVAMLSFAAGNHRYFTTAFKEFGLINQMSVRAKSQNASDTTRVAVLNNDAVRRFTKIPGVRLAYPYSTFDVTAAVLDTSVSTTARSLPPDALRTRLFSKILGGLEFSSDSANEAIVTHEFAEEIGVAPDSLVGQTLTISMRLASLDSAVAAVIGDPQDEVRELFRRIKLDSIYYEDYQRRVLRRELSDRARRFIDGLMKRQAVVSDTLVISGIAPRDERYQFRIAPVIIPERTAQRLSTGGFAISDNPAELFAAVRDGSLFDAAPGRDSRSYPRVTLELEPLTNHKAVKDSVEAMGYRAYSLAEQFDEIQRFMVYYYLGLGVIGLIALLTASLGISNTLVMSVTERRREIGILKSLGAHESDIRWLFLVESGMIGAIGAAVGIVVGWLGTRVVALIARTIMERENMPVFDPFSLPL